MVHIDGSQGEGGGQVMRSALTLAAMTGQEAHITDIRAGRPKPGLRAQHLTAVKAITRVTRAQVEGAALGSTELVFRPGEIRSGNYRFDIQTAGATSLVLQTIFLPLSAARSASTVNLTGGTHVPWSPSFHYLEMHWLPYLRRAGFDARLTLELAGFYPQGGGRLQARIHPAGEVTPLDITDRGPLKRITGISAVANLARNIGDRQRRQAQRRLGERHPLEIRVVDLPSRVKGTFLLLLAEFEAAQAAFTALGARGKPAERVADEAVDALETFLATDGCVDPYLADQLLLPLAFASGESRIRTAPITLHLVTNAQVLQAFLPVEVDIGGEIGAAGVVRIKPAAG